ncbi:transcriptional regulator [Pseudomonas sp. S37]|uniref:helix-turn-helix domain-containing protein n=1 Tax=Pseudomonas sp. S37 TaxID=2767449 RepID=UPI001912ED13|nr:helix-turn-helix domain-containing protein [Pseudomonas sp. S37]MBK4992468.1 transcriptional regulator [Pseudomonas sp. S37]
MDPTETLAAVVRGVRRSKGLSQHDFAGIDLSYMGKIERGEVNISVDLLNRLAQGLGLEPATLLLLQASPDLVLIDHGLERVVTQIIELKHSGAIEHISQALSERNEPGGRPLSMGSEQKISAALQLRSQGVPVVKIARELGLSEATVRRYLKRAVQTQDDSAE